MICPDSPLHSPRAAAHVVGHLMDVLELCSAQPGRPHWAALIAHSSGWGGPFPKGVG